MVAGVDAAMVVNNYGRSCDHGYGSKPRLTKQPCFFNDKNDPNRST